MRRTLLMLALASCLAPAACAPGYYGQARNLVEAGDPAAAVPLYYREIQDHPDSWRAWRELGVAYYDQNDYAKAEEALKHAATMHPDARTHLYLGMTYEGQDQSDLALRAYGNALGLEPDGHTRDLIEARVEALTQERVLAKVRQSLDSEDKLNAAEIPQNTIAVVEFADEDLPPDMAPLARGLAEFTALDLAKVSQLKVVDRLEMDAIRKELDLSRSQFADPATAPRIGLLIGGRHIVTGTLLGLGDDAIRLDGAVVNTVDKSVDTPGHVEGPLPEIFRVQKKFVFDVLDALDIKPTPEERAEIEKSPTENYLAFLAYCRGLQARDADNLGMAAQEFHQAAAADPGFSQAASQGRTVSSLLQAGFGGGASFQQFRAVVSAASAAEAGAAGLASFGATVATWNGFVPVGANLVTIGQWVDAPPHTLYQGDVNIVVRGNLNVQP